MKKLIILSLIIVFCSFCFTFAQVSIPNPMPWDNFEELVSRLIEWIINIALVVAPLVIVWGGLSFATAGGDPTKIQKAKTMLLYAAVGLGVVLLAKSLVDSLKKIIVLPSD